MGSRPIMQINWSGLIIFAAFCLLLWAVVSRPTWMPLAEGAATVLILLAIAGIAIPRLRKHRGM